MIQQLREQSQSPLFKLLLIFIAITFVISFGIGSFFGDRKEVLATINSEDLLAKEFQKAYSESLENLRRQFGNNADQFAEQFNLRKQVFNQLIDRKLQLAEANRQGIQITDSELQDFITNLPYFKKDDYFDFETYKQILQQNRLTIDDFEKQSSTDLLTQKYQETVLAGIVVSDLEVEQKYRQANEKFQVSYIYFDPKAFTGNVDYQQDDLQKYYEKNPKKFERREQYQIEYFLLNLDQFKATATVKEREITRYYEKNRDEYTTPSEVKARHILIKSSSDLSDEEKAAKKKQAEDILIELKDGANFIELVKKYSEDISREKGGDLGWFKPGEMVAGFEAAAFELEPLQISGVIESPFGFHIIRVDEKKPETTKTLDDVRDDVVELLKDKRAEKKLELEYNRLLDKMEQEKDLANIAKSFDSQIVKSPLFDNQSTIQGLGSTRELANQLVRENEGDYGRFKRNPVQGYIFYKLSKIRKPETKPLEEVKTSVIDLVKTEKAKTLANQTAQEESSKFFTVESLSELAETHKLKVNETSFTVNATQISTIGHDPEFKKQVLKTEIQKSGFSENSGKSYIFVLTGVDFPDQDNAEKKDAIRNQILQQLRRSLSQKDSTRLRDDANIQILSEFFKDDITLN